MNKDKLQEFIDGISFKAQHYIIDSFTECYFSNVDKSYLTHVGMEESLSYLLSHGITEQIQNSKGVAEHSSNIGFNPVDQKWFGWSHRALYGFGVGSEIKRGDCAYCPVDEDDFRASVVEFWSGEHHKGVSGEFKEEDGLKGVYISWTYTDDTPNEKIRGSLSGSFSPFPDMFGKGEWKAKTMDEAREMACDFAESVS